MVMDGGRRTSVSLAAGKQPNVALTFTGLTVMHMDESLLRPRVALGCIRTCAHLPETSYESLYEIAL